MGEPLLSVLFCERGEVLGWSPVRAGSCGMRPSFIRFFCFIRRFWNQIFTCKQKATAEVTYMVLYLKKGGESKSLVTPSLYLTKCEMTMRVVLRPYFRTIHGR